MKVMIVDDEEHALEAIASAVKNFNKLYEIKTFDLPSSAFDYAKDNHIDIAFIDIEMPEINGIDLAKRLKSINNNINIIFVTGYSEYMVNAFELHVSGYVLKPINPKRIEDELENLRHPIEVSNQGLYILCFGNFEVLYDGKPITFKRTKSKEAFAYLVDRFGSSVSKKELAAILLEDTPYTRITQSYISNIIVEMYRTLRDINCQDIILHKHGAYSIDKSILNCDYYAYEKGIPYAINKYNGEYMTNYSWAEYTAGFLLDKNKKNT